MDPELLRTVIDQREDEGPRMVLADQLLERGDPRGELIQLQCMAESFDEEDPRQVDIDERVQTTKGMPLMRELVASGPLTDAGAVALAESPGFRRILWLELNTREVTDFGRAALRRRFGHHQVVLDAGLLHAFSALSRRV